MRKFTKSLMTLALLCVAGVANAQDEWVDLPATGWVHEWRTNDAQTDAAALTDTDGAYKVYVRSKEAASAAGNMTEDGDGNFADWDSQFFITFGEANKLKVGDVLKVTMKVKADVAVTVPTQSHAAPGGYLHWYCIGDVAFTTAYTEISRTEEITSDQGGMYTIAFNLAKGAENTCYFKDIKVQVKKAKEITWTDIITNGNLETIENKNFTITEQGVGGPYMANIKAGIGKSGSRGISVQSSDSPTDPWDTQFFISVPKKLVSGTKCKVSFDYKASKAAKGATQWHNAPGGYVWWSCIGDVNFTTDWQNYEKTNVINRGSLCAQHQRRTRTRRTPVHLNLGLTISIETNGTRLPVLVRIGEIKVSLVLIIVFIK